MPSPPSRRSRVRRAATAVLLLVASVAVPRGAAAQEPSDGYTLRSPSGASLSFSADAVKAMLDRTRRLTTILEEDPEVLYYVGTGGPVERSDPASAYPWRAVRPLSDSTARVEVPANYREARRAYYAYAVRTMETIREAAPSARCGEAVEREEAAVSAFVDGWIVTRTLYGGPAFAPLDLFAFAREAGHLSAMIVELGDTRLGACGRRWARDHPEALEAYRSWREDFDADRS